MIVCVIKLFGENYLLPAKLLLSSTKLFGSCHFSPFLIGTLKTCNQLNHRQCPCNIELTAIQKFTKAKKLPLVQWPFAWNQFQKQFNTLYWYFSTMSTDPYKIRLSNNTFYLQIINLFRCERNYVLWLKQIEVS